MQSENVRTMALLVVGMAAALLAGCAAQQPERPAVEFTTEPWSYAGRPACRLMSDHYEIHTTLADPVLREALPDFVEAAYAYFTELLPPARSPTERMEVYLFASRGQWEAFTKRFTGPRASVFLKIRNGGYSEQGVSVIEYVAHEVTFPLFAHEGFHQYVHHCVNGRMPAWLNEGLAVCCEGQRWGAVRLRRFDPWNNPRRFNDLAEALAGSRLHPLRKLLATNAGEIIEGSSRSVATYYAQVWGLVLFLREGAGGKYAPGLQRLLAALQETDVEQYARAAHIWSDEAKFNPGEELFRSFISQDLDAFEREYLGFLREKFLGARPLVARPR